MSVYAEWPLSPEFKRKSCRLVMVDFGQTALGFGGEAGCLFDEIANLVEPAERPAWMAGPGRLARDSWCAAWVPADLTI
jgi:hypothetical protein